MLIVFGADVNKPNEYNQSPRHLAATSKGPNRFVGICIFLPKLCLKLAQVCLSCMVMHMHVLDSFILQF